MTSNMTLRLALAAVLLLAGLVDEARAQAPAYFNLTSPTTAAVIEVPTDVDGRFVWQASTGATKYVVELLPQPNNDWTTALKIETTQTQLTWLNPDTHPLVMGKEVFWRVQACNAQNACVYNLGNPRSVRIPLNPAALVAPAAGGVSATAQPTFEWKPLAGAQFYKVVFGGTVITSGSGVSGGTCSNGTCSFTPATDLAGTSVQWHVQSCAMIGGGMLCGAAFNQAQQRRLTIGQPMRRDSR